MSISARVRRTSGVVVKVILLVLGFSLLWSSGAAAALYLKFDGINGESVDEQHRDWSEISRVDWRVIFESQGVGGARGPVRADFADFYWQQKLDRSFPKLFTNLASGKTIFDAKVDFTTDSEDRLTYFQMQFWNVRLTYLELDGDSNSLPTFIGAFNYDRIYMKYYAYDAEGHATIYEAGYDVAKNTGWLPELLEVYVMGMSGPTITTTSHTPVPASVLLLGTALLGLAGLGWRRKGR